ncbi:unnamed protein product [Effrenium voratum]|nr:unnamed protein product [Effrenium voratum]
MAFRTSAHLSHLRTQKTVEQLGAAASCRVGREDVLFQVDVLREYVPVVLPLMLANVLCPSVLPDEVGEACAHVVELQQMMEDKPDSLVVELLHVAAYQGTLGHNLYATEKPRLPRAAEWRGVARMPEILSGEFSPLGRSTGRSLQRLRSQAGGSVAIKPKAAFEVESPGSPTSWPASPTSPGSPTSPKDRAEKPEKAEKLLAKFRVQRSPSSPSLASTAASETLAQRPNTAAHAAHAAHAAGAANGAAGSAGLEEGGLCETTRAVYNRFMHPSRDSKPEPGHYRVNEDYVWHRAPQWDIGEPRKSEPIRPREKDTGMELGETWSSLASPSPTGDMGLSPTRPDVTSL